MLQITLDRPGAFTASHVTQPGPPGPGEALVQVRRIGVCGTDLHAFAGRQPFFDYPRVLGHELGVEVLDAPDNARGIRVGQFCAVEPYLNCGRCIACRRGRPNCCEQMQVLGVHTDGGMREQLIVPVEKLHRAASLNLDQLALVETLAIGAHAVARGNPAAGESVLVIGAGPIGLGVLQFLQARGVQPIVADVSAKRIAFARDVMGTGRTVNAADGPLADMARQANGGELPTLVFDATGHAQSMQNAFDVVAHGGRLVFVGLVQDTIAFRDPEFHRRELTLLASRNATSDDLREVIRRIESGQVDTTPWVTHRLNLADVPAQFASLPASPGLIKAMIDV